MGEFIYRAIAIQQLDAFPIGGELLFDRVPDWFPFQREAPFGFFPARVGEFALGMVAAAAFLQNQTAFSKILFTRWTMICGIMIWLSGNALLTIKAWGWIFSDFVIGLGLVFGLLNLANFSRQHWPKVFSHINCAIRRTITAAPVTQISQSTLAYTPCD